MFDTLSDRLNAAFRNLRGKTRLTDADIDATAREIRLALLEADVNLGVVKDFIAAVKELGVPVPIVIRMEGTNVELGKKILRESGLPIIAADNLADAARKVVEATKTAMAA